MSNLEKRLLDLKETVQIASTKAIETQGALKQDQERLKEFKLDNDIDVEIAKDRKKLQRIERKIEEETEELEEVIG